MILRYAGESTLITAITPQVVRKVLILYDVQCDLKTTVQQLITESANGPSMALRRLREKVTRLDKRLARLNNAQLSSAQDNEERKTSVKHPVRTTKTE